MMMSKNKDSNILKIEKIIRKKVKKIINICLLQQEGVVCKNIKDHFKI